MGKTHFRPVTVIFCWDASLPKKVGFRKLYTVFKNQLPLEVHNLGETVFTILECFTNL